MSCIDMAADENLQTRGSCWENVQNRSDGRRTVHLQGVIFMKHLNFNQVHFVFYAFNSLPSTSFTNFISQKKKKRKKESQVSPSASRPPPEGWHQRNFIPTKQFFEGQIKRTCRKHTFFPFIISSLDIGVPPATQSSASLTTLLILQRFDLLDVLFN